MTGPGPITPEEHERWREALGAYALGDLHAEDQTAVRAHLDGCLGCRADLAEIAPLAALLDGVDLADVDSPASPPPDLGDRIRRAVAAEQRQRDHDERVRRRRERRSRRRSRALVGAAAAAVLVGAVGAGALVGRASAPAVPQAAPVPYEEIPLAPVGASEVQVDQAGLVPHTWGVELRMEGSGFVEGATYRAAFRDTSGRLTPAGEFLGTGDAAMSCNLQSALLRDDASIVVVTDEQGTPVLRSRL